MNTADFNSASGARGNNARGAPDKALSLSELIGMFRRRLRLFLSIVIAVTAIAVVVTFVIPPRFTATATVKVDPSARSFIDKDQGSSGDMLASARLDTELRIAKSRKVAVAVVEQMKLADDPEYAPKDAKGTPAERQQSVVDAVMNASDIQRDGLTYVVNFSFTSKNPEKAALIANAFAQEYIAESVRVRLAGVQAQAQALSSGLDNLGKEASQAAAAAAEFRARNGLVDAMNQSTAVQQQASSLAVSLSGAQSDLARSQSELQQAEAQMAANNIEAIPGVLDSPVIQDYRRQRTEVARIHAENASKYGPRHPEFIKSQQQLATLDRQIREEAGQIVRSLRAQVRSDQERVRSMQGNLARTQGQLAANNSAEVQAQSLDRNAEAASEIYREFQKAQQSASQQTNLNAPQAIIVSQAVAPLSASFPNKPLFALLGGFMGVVLGAAAIFIADALATGILNAKEAEDLLGAPVMASVPLLSPPLLRKAGRGASPDNYVIAKPMSAYAEALRSVKSALVLSGVDRPVKTIAFTSALPGEGKTATCISFARVLGMGGAKVVLIDGDLRRGSMSRLGGGDRAVGLMEVLNGSASLDQALVKDEVEGVQILSLVRASFTPRDLFGSEAIGRLFAELRERFDYVIIDSPPVLAVNDARTLAKMADAVVFVCRWAKTPRAAASSAINLLERDGALVAGVALSMVDFSAKGALAGSDPSYYYSSYRRYYQE